ncbi:ANTAR domain-containing protein [Streptomyces sp. WAC07149]|uniref:SpoIIE family protein phosphatase n=1 Tax=Streptomyces sp. WAC07149 TaxID=2487425 RepID=UPI000F7762EF|nr:SpoIIE family protein phosphatase [Streptomyces sp. WAC07149]RST06664.1 ANTAR domain-containing protein [Streptomyces sp. WAC07149]
MAKVVARLRSELARVQAGVADGAAIEQAKGVLMALDGLSPEAAGDELASRARADGLPLADEARRILDRMVRQPPAQASGTNREVSKLSTSSYFSSTRYLSKPVPSAASSPAEALRPHARPGARRTRGRRALTRQQELVQRLPGSVVVLTPLRGSAGEIEDYRIDSASPGALDIAGRTGKDLIGLHVLEAYPMVLGTDLWEGYGRALESGEVWVGEPFEYEEVVSGIPRLSRFHIQAQPWRGRLVVSWVRLDAGEREERRLAVMQRLGNLGWADWDLTTDTITWSEQVYTIFGRDRRNGPMTLEELPRHVPAEDLPALGHSVERLLGDGRPIDHSFRITTPAGLIRHVRIVAEADCDAEGTPVEVHGFFQDVTETKEFERELLERRIAAIMQESQLKAERDLAGRLRHALLPLPRQSVNVGGLHVEIAYEPAQQGLNVGGDWYSAIELLDNSALLVVGDVAGHGMASVGMMAQLRFTAKGMAVTGTPLTHILARLNVLLLHSGEDHVSTATVIMARYQPKARRLTWARAGHCPPLLIRQGEAHYLDSPDGILLGASHEARYAEATLLLDRGDQLLLYTDGVVEEPGEDIQVGLNRLADMAAAAHAADGRVLLDTVLAALPDRSRRRDDVCLVHITAH